MICFIGIGKAGKTLAKIASERTPGSDLVTFDEVDSSHKVPKFSTPEEYEKKYKVPRKITDADEIIIFLAGSGNTSFITLKIVEKLKKKPISVVYVRPFLKNLSEQARKKERVVFGVLSHFALSAKFKLYMYDSQKITDKVGSAPVLSMYSKINEYVIWSYLTYRFLLASDKVISYYDEPPEHSLLLCLDLKREAEPEVLESFGMKNPRGCNLLFVVPQTALQEDESLIDSIEAEKKKYEIEIPKCTYTILEAENEEHYHLIEKFTNYPQYITGD